MENSTMPFSYNREFLDSGLDYLSYRKGINDMLSRPAADENGEKLQHYTRKNVALMDEYDQTCKLSDDLKKALELTPPTIWVVISEGWCGDAAFNVPIFFAAEKAFPGKIILKLFLRDSNLALMDANLTDGGRSIPKLIILDEDYKQLGEWGPRPAGLQQLMKEWKNKGLQLKELIPKVKEWYDHDATRSIQEELVAIIKNYS